MSHHDLTKIHQQLLLRKHCSKGFSLIEAMAALAIFTIIFAVSAPLFFTQQKSNIDSEVRTGAVSLSQQKLDTIRTDISTPKKIEGATGRSLGKEYLYNLYVCTKEIETAEDGSINCSTEKDPSNPIRHILLEVKYNENTVYTVETVYTALR
ncbi:prepilin-type N-terminal cleavage/methylation domain-containing protein [Picosynechococcus sp. PCC 7003]|uniref:type IV pilus modification PilV family protein n=1 Tax=Picosynechococcus sp. PCC 7003 TaxID=374981 RepID=UPI000903D641|nr:type II secretion system protein [Picosynechococcus sp. PCC 7003]